MVQNKYNTMFKYKHMLSIYLAMYYNNNNIKAEIWIEIKWS